MVRMFLLLAACLLACGGVHDAAAQAQSGTTNVSTSMRSMALNPIMKVLPSAIWRAIVTLMGTAIFLIPPEAQAQFGYAVNSEDTNTITITSYTGPGGSVLIPSSINGLAVTGIGVEALQGNTNITSLEIPGGVLNIGTGAFDGCSALMSATIPSTITNIGEKTFYECFQLSNVTISNGLTDIPESMFDSCENLTNITIPASVVNIGDGAFIDCLALAGAYFQGNAPDIAETAFFFDAGLTVYYSPGTAGWIDWSDPYTGSPAVEWNPAIAAAGMQNGQFGVTVTGNTNIPIQLQACTNLSSPVWTPLTNVNLTNGSFYYSEPMQSNAASRFYRVCFP